MFDISSIFKDKENRSLLGGRLKNLAKVSIKIQNKKLNGNIAECGVYRGGSARLLATIFPEKKIFLFDSFQGMIENDSINTAYKPMKKGDFSNTSLDSVKEYLSDKSNCLFFQGWLPQSAYFLDTETHKEEEHNKNKQQQEAQQKNKKTKKQRIRNTNW